MPGLVLVGTQVTLAEQALSPTELPLQLPVRMFVMVVVQAPEGYTEEAKAEKSRRLIR